MQEVFEYRREEAGAQPPALHPPYASTLKRAPRQPPVRCGPPPADQATTLQLLDQRRHRRFVAGDRAPQGDLGDARIFADHHHRREIPGPPATPAGILREAAEGGILREPQMERDEVPQRAQMHLRVAGFRGWTVLCHAPCRRGSCCLFMASIPRFGNWFAAKPSTAYAAFQLEECG